MSYTRVAALRRADKTMSSYLIQTWWRQTSSFKKTRLQIKARKQKNLERWHSNVQVPFWTSWEISWKECLPDEFCIVYMSNIELTGERWSHDKDWVFGKEMCAATVLLNVNIRHLYFVTRYQVSHECKDF